MICRLSVYVFRYLLQLGLVVSRSLPGKMRFFPPRAFKDGGEKAERKEAPQTGRRGVERG